MKTPQLFTLILGLLAFQGSFAQKKKLVDKREQAQGWFVPIHGQVLVNGARTKNAEVILYRDNEKLGRMAARKKGRFELQLDIDRLYAIHVVKPGFQDKLIYIDTTLPRDLVVYPDYFCFVDLSPELMKNMDPFYSDFPSAIVRYDAMQKGFYHSDPYLAHIHTKRYGFARVGQ